MSTSSLPASIANLNALASPPPPPTSLGLPEPVYGHPLRNSQSNDDDDDPWQSPPSVTQFAASLAHRVGSLISPAPGTRALPSDAELEAEAQRERDQSRREAERILTREAEQRRAVEERILAMMNSGSPPPPRARSQTLPNPPSPASPSSPGWWQAAKSRLTPTKDKEPLTPAQQVVEETRSKDRRSPNNLGRPTSPSPVRLSPVPASQPINLSPISLQRGTSPGGTPAREQPPMYASFTPSGTLDVPGTLLVIAKRFEKLERWTVSHVRALEERMGDVERWLVEKETERTKDKGPPDTDLVGVKDDITELQGRITEIGREMARLATSPAILSTNTAVRASPEMRSAPPTESMIVTTHASATSPPESTTSTPAASAMATPRRAPSLTARESTSPPLARAGSSKKTSRTRLPYPTGDYASPSDVVSPPHTPASSPPPGSRPTSMLISGLPMSPPSRPMSPPTRVTSPTGLPPPSAPSARRGSVSPTPLPGGRKRYTVALGGPIVAPPEIEAEYDRERRGVMGTAYFSGTTEGSEDDDEEHGGEMVGRKGGARVGGEQGSSVRAVPASPRVRAQSTYGPPSSALSKHRLRSQSTDFGAESAEPVNRFVDPLVLRRQSKGPGRESKPLVGPGRKVPVGQLVAFFDSEGHR